LVPFLYGGRTGTGEGGERGNRRADVDRLVFSLARPRFCSSSLRRQSGRFLEWLLLVTVRRRIRGRAVPGRVARGAGVVRVAEDASDLPRLEALFTGAVGDGGAVVLLLPQQIDGEVFFSGGLLRSVVFLFALGKVPLCSPVGFFFRVGDLVAGAGSSAGPWLPPGGCGASFTSGRLWRDLQEGWISSASFVRSQIRVQRIRSILAGATGWWILRLHQGLRSSDGAVEVLGVRGIQPGGTEQTRKMNNRIRVWCVISLFCKGLVVKGGSTVLFFNISSLSAKKKANRPHLILPAIS